MGPEPLIKKRWRRVGISSMRAGSGLAGMMNSSTRRRKRAGTQALPSLLRILAGLSTPARGTIARDISAHEPQSSTRGRVSV